VLNVQPPHPLSHVHSHLYINKPYSSISIKTSVLIFACYDVTSFIMLLFVFDYVRCEHYNSVHPRASIESSPVWYTSCVKLPLNEVLWLIILNHFGNVLYSVHTQENALYS